MRVTWAKNHVPGVSPALKANNMRYFIFFYIFTDGSKVGIGHGWAGLSWVGMPPAKRAKALIAKSNNLDPGGLAITGFQELSLEDFQAFTLDD